MSVNGIVDTQTNQMLQITSKNERLTWTEQEFKPLLFTYKKSH